MKIEHKINDELALYGLAIEDLTADELAELEDEIERKEQGAVILDGVLASIPLYERLQPHERKKSETAESENMDIF